jgi:hypothetical protein
MTVWSLFSFVQDQRVWWQGFPEHGTEPLGAMKAGLFVIN